MKNYITIGILSGIMVTSSPVMANTLETLLGEYQTDAPTTFNAQRGKDLWSKEYIDAQSGETRSCATCHTKDLRAPSKHITTGKAIEPLAPSANKARLTDIKKIKKWLLRNCKWTMGRECSPQEKGDFLQFISEQ